MPPQTAQRLLSPAEDAGTARSPRNPPAQTRWTATCAPGGCGKAFAGVGPTDLSVLGAHPFRSLFPFAEVDDKGTVRCPDCHKALVIAGRWAGRS